MAQQGGPLTIDEKRERNRLRSERCRRAHGIMPRKSASKPWLAEGISRSTYYRRRAKARQQAALAAVFDRFDWQIAGLWDQWNDPETSEAVLSATLIVTTANDFTRPIHDRMPVLLGRQDHEAWLSGTAGPELLRPAPNDLLQMWPVSKRVNASGSGDDDPGLIEPVEDEANATS